MYGILIVSALLFISGIIRFYDHKGFENDIAKDLFLIIGSGFIFLLYLIVKIIKGRFSYHERAEYEKGKMRFLLKKDKLK
jgi:TM2 domain-containing membrane protein YozV